MVIDFSKIPAANIDGFKGGKGLFVCRAFGDDTCKIMKNILPQEHQRVCTHMRPTVR